MNLEFEIDFGASGNGRTFMVTGWSDVEQDETWAVNGTSLLALAAPRQAADYFLMLKMRPHVVPGRLQAQRLQVLVNGTEVAKFTVSGPTIRACRIPWHAIEGSKALEIQFRMPDAAKPAEHGGRDDRTLGIAFSNLKLFPDTGSPSGSASSGAGASPVPVEIDKIAVADRISIHDLMLKFESLGQNCEFGLVQRKCGAEPLGLLRFPSAPLPTLLAALDARFEGLGEPGAVHVQISNNGRELMINDSRFGFLYHAFVKTGEMDAAAVHQREVRRMPFLVRKLLEDLAAAEKIFVFKGMSALDEEQIFALVAALRRYGPNTLLFVTLADAQHPPGTVEARSPGFFVGYLARFAPMEDAQNFDLANWVRVCRGAYRLLLAGVSATHFSS